MNLNPGDTCKVRLHDGRVVEAVYDKKSMLDDGKAHVVIFDGVFLWARREIISQSDCRFVANPCVLETV